MTKKANLILHPTRMRIIQALHSNQQLTTKELQSILSDVPQATLYRQIKQLADADLIHVVDSHQVRGAKEKVYALHPEQLKIPDQEVASMSNEELIKHFMAYQTNILNEFERYIQQSGPEKFRLEGLGFSQTTLNLNEKEREQFGVELSQLIQKYSQLPTTTDRTSLTLGITTVPQSSKEDTK